MIHINGHRPERTFVRVERPQEQYYASGSDYHSVAGLAQALFDKPRDATSLLTTLEQLPLHGLIQVHINTLHFLLTIMI